MSGVRREGARLDATVMFADLSGFTALSERLDPEAATELVNCCFAALESVVLAYGGVIDQYIGDCVKAFWGADGGGAARAVAAAAAIREVLDGLGGEAGAVGIHVGLASGPVVARDLGGEARHHVTVVGETVAVAQYLGEAGARGQVIADRATQAEAGPGFTWGVPTPVAIAHRAEPVVAVELRTAAGAGERAAVVAAAAACSREPLTAAELDGRRLRRDSERRQATIVFAEVAGIERLGHVLAPERLTDLLDRCFSALAPAVERHGGVIDKYIGATLMALFGVPNAIEQAPQQALAAAAELRLSLRRFAGEEGLDETLHVRVGVNSGLVIAGDIGGRATRAFTVIGDAVNVAARLKDAAGYDEIYVGRDTQRAARDTVALTPLPPLPLKGKVDAVPVWRLEAGAIEPGARASEPRPIGSVLVGRLREFDAVAQAVARLGSGLGGVVGIVGEAGIGKSRLLAELLRLPALRQVQVLGGRALSIGQRLAFHPVSAMLRRWAGVEEQDAPADAAVKLARAVRAAMPDEFDDVSPFLARLAGVPLREADAERLRRIDGEALEALIFKAARDLCERLAADRPLLLLFEDLHWAYQSSVKLIEGLLRLTVARPVLLVLTARPDFADTSGRVLQAAREQASLRLTEVAIGRLADHECEALIQNLLGADTLPYPTRALIIRKAEGNPFFIEEVIRSFLDAGVVERRDGRIQLTAQLDTIDVPSTVQDVILSRVDRLDEHTRHVLQIASVVGRSFSHRILADVLGDDAGELGGDLARLKERQLISERQAHAGVAAPRTRLGAALEYRFTHALAQEAVYGSILQRTRRDLHRRVAASVERLFADRLADVYGMLAYHYSRAEELAKAEEFLFKAGEEAASAAASAEALTFFREAAQLYVRIHGAGGDARKRALLEKNIARALLNTGALTESIEHFDEALQRLGERVRRRPWATYGRFVTDLVAVLAGLYLGGGRRRGAATVTDVDREVFEVVFDRARALTTSDPRRLFFESIGAIHRLNRCDASQVEGACAFYAGSSALFAFTAFSYDVSARFLAIAEPLIRSGSVRDRFTYRTFWFVHHYLQGNWEPTYAIEPALVDEALRAGGLWDVNTYVGLYCDLLLRQGYFAGAGALVERLGEINDAYGYGFAGTNRDAMRTLLLLERRQLDAAQASAEAYQRARHEEPLKVLGLGSKAKAQVLLGDLEGAADTLRDAEQVLRRSSDVPPWHLSAYVAARLRYDIAACAGGDPAAWRRLADSARRAGAVARKVAVQRVEIGFLRGRAYRLLGNARRTSGAWRAALESAQRLGARPEAARGAALIAQSLGTASFAGRDAAAWRAQAERELTALGLEWDLAQLSRTAAPDR